MPDPDRMPLWECQLCHHERHKEACVCGCDVCGGAHSNAEHMANCDADGRYVPPSRDVSSG